MEEVTRKELRVLSVGQCGYDDSRIGRLVGDIGGRLERSCDAIDALEKLHAKKYQLVLINRIFDSDGDSGLEFINTARKAGVKIPLMLISDYPEAQTAAIAHGALPGFGKSQLGTADVLAKLRAAVIGMTHASN